MKSYPINASLVLFLTLFSHLLLGQELVEVPKLERRVTDLAGLLSSNEMQALEQELKAFEDTTGSQIALLVIPSTKPETIEQYSIRVVDEWKIGRENVDDGVLLIVARTDRKLRIEVGSGLEGAIPDAIAKRIISRIIVPHFRDGDYYLGIEEGLEAIMTLVSGEDLPLVTSTESSGDDLTSLLYFFGIIFAIIAVVIFKGLISTKLGNTKSNLIVIPLIFIVVWVLINLSAAFFATIFAFIFMNGRRGGGTGGRRRHGGGYVGWGGYSGGGGGFSGGFGGGFSGGGGGFSGGGASGGW